MWNASRAFVAAAVFAASGIGAPAGAQDVVSPRLAERAAAASAVVADPFDEAVPDTDLRREAGREDVGAMVASATQRNTVANNSVIGHSVTGEVRIDGNAFQNVQGLAVVSANSGNNVAINAAMNVTINMAPR